MSEEKLKITLSANAGVCIELCGRRYYIDALHNSPSLCFSALSGDMAERFISAAGAPDIVIYTHTHPDHYSEPLAKKLMSEHPGAVLIMPDGEKDISTGFEEIELIKLTHMGEYRDYPNYGIIINSGGKKLFASGDSDPQNEEVIEKISGLNPDFALLNFNWITLRSGRNALALLNPRSAAFAHLPYPEEDSEGYVRPTLRCRDRFSPQSAVLCSFLQTETIVI